MTEETNAKAQEETPRLKTWCLFDEEELKSCEKKNDGARYFVCSREEEYFQVDPEKMRKASSYFELAWLKSIEERELKGLRNKTRIIKLEDVSSTAMAALVAFAHKNVTNVPEMCAGEIMKMSYKYGFDELAEIAKTTLLISEGYMDQDKMLFDIARDWQGFSLDDEDELDGIAPLIKMGEDPIVTPESTWSEYITDKAEDFGDWVDRVWNDTWRKKDEEEVGSGEGAKSDAKKKDAQTEGRSSALRKKRRRDNFFNFAPRK